MPKRPRNAKAVNSKDEDIEANLLKPWPRSAPLDKVPMHMGGLMHGLVAVAREKWASSWPQHCCIMSGSMAPAPSAADGAADPMRTPDRTSLGSLGSEAGAQGVPSLRREAFV